MGLLNKKKSNDLPVPSVPLQDLTYNGKILLAWGEAISGNREIRDWLIKNGYPELGLFVFALHNKDNARNWLMENGFAHLFALINGAEGNIEALRWLHLNGFDALEAMARAGDGDLDAFEWLRQHGYADLAVIAARIKKVKQEIEENNNDIHKISTE
jgi:hypothetical protein